MLDVNEQPSLPPYQIRVGTDVKTFDPLIIGFKLRHLEGVSDPAAVQKAVCEVFEIEVDSLRASAILSDYFKFAKEEMEEPLKKVFGRGLFSATTTESTPAQD